MGEMTVSSGAIPDTRRTRGSLCRCNEAVGGIFVTCLMNVAMAR
jgi:hypothetical protein